jgi:uncharacterized protein (DUF924 family)
MYIDDLRHAVAYFHSVWFPGADSQVNQPFWFRARNAKYVETIRQLCDNCMHAVEHVLRNEISPVEILHACQDWPKADILVLSIMLDQMPRNALAIGFGRYKGMDPLDVASAIDNSYSLSLARAILSAGALGAEDYRITCFFSLVFRHSNDFENARKVLRSISHAQLPPLAEKFIAETDKREASFR